MSNMELKKENKTLPFEIKSIDSSDDFFTFKGYASTFGNVDLGNDIIEKGAFQETLAKNAGLPILWQHSMQEPIGKSTTLYEDEKGLYIEAKLPKEDTFVSGRVIPQMKVGSIQEMSIGYFTKKEEYDNENHIRRLKEIDLFEVSLVTKAMNPQALVSDFKSLADSIVSQKEIDETQKDQIEASIKELQQIITDEQPADKKEDKPLDNIKKLGDIESLLKEKGFSNNEAKGLIAKVKEFSNQREAEEKNEDQRDVETKAKILAELTDLTNFIKQNKN